MDLSDLRFGNVYSVRRNERRSRKLFVMINPIHAVFVDDAEDARAICSGRMSGGDRFNVQRRAENNDWDISSLRHVEKVYEDVREDLQREVQFTYDRDEGTISLKIIYRIGCRIFCEDEAGNHFEGSVHDLDRSCIKIVAKPDWL